MEKLANNKYPVNNFIKSRWSPRTFSSKPVDKAKINSILEAARWAPSAFNEQPWRFIVGLKGEKTYDFILESLVEWNQNWAGLAPVLILNIAKKTFTHNNKPNVTFKYDLGQSVGLMILEIVNQGLVSHQMSGFDPDKASKLLNIPDNYQAVSVTAVGYHGDIKDLSEELAKLELKERVRKDLNTIVFSSEFGKPFDV